VASLPAAEREALLEQAARLLADHLGSDDPATPLDWPYVTEAYLLAPER
jgi:hypothetical protein